VPPDAAREAEGNDVAGVGGPGDGVGVAGAGVAGIAEVSTPGSSWSGRGADCPHATEDATSRPDINQPAAFMFSSIRMIMLFY
jgi:hypothetical protein